MDLLSLLTGSIITGSATAIITSWKFKTIKDELENKSNQCQIDLTAYKDMANTNIKKANDLEKQVTDLKNELSGVKENARLQLSQQSEQFSNEWATYANQVQEQFNTYANQVNQLESQVNQLNGQLKHQQQLTLSYSDGCQYYQTVIQQYNQALIEATKEIDFYRNLSGIRNSKQPIPQSNNNGNHGTTNENTVVDNVGLQEKGWISSGGISSVMNGWKPLPSYPQEIK